MGKDELDDRKDESEKFDEDLLIVLQLDADVERLHPSEVLRPNS